MSLLTIVQQVCQIHTLQVPTVVAGSTNTTIKQMQALLNELLDDMVDESQYQAFTHQATFTLIADEDQGDISEIATDGYLWAHNETFFDRTLRRPVYGPLTDVEWQQIKALPNPGPWYKYRIRQNHILVNPVPTDSPFSLIAFEYASSYGVRNADGDLQSSFIADDDEFILPEKILRKGLSFRWKQVKGLNYQADEEAYYKLLNNAIARDATKRPMNMADNVPLSLQPGIFVPSGNWPVTS